MKNREPTPLLMSGAAGLAGFAAVAALTWVSLTTAQLGCFRAWVSLLGGGLALAAVWQVCKKTQGLPRATARGSRWVVLAFAFGSLLFTLPPSEMILGGWDPGVYLHTAASVAREGTLRFNHPDLASLDGLAKTLFSRDLFSISEPFGGMRILPDGSLSPQFYHAYPSLLAVFWSLGGVWAALLVNPLINVGCILLIAALVGRIAGARWAPVAAFLMVLNPAQIWQAKFSTAEILGQFFLLGGAVLWIDVHRDRPTTLKAILAGVAFGLGLLTRYDALLLLAPLAGLSLLCLPVTANRKGVLIALCVLGVFVGQVWLHQRFVAPYYRPMIALVLPALGALVALLLVWLPLAFSRFGRRYLGQVQSGWVILRWVFAVAFAAWTAFAWWIRPALGTGRIDARAVEKLLDLLQAQNVLRVLAGRESDNMLYLVELLGPGLLFFAAAGIFLMLVRSRDTAIVTWLYASVGVFCLLTWNIFHDHFLLWVARRFVPVVMPLLIVGTVVFIKYVMECFPVRRNKVMLGGGLAALLIALHAGPVVLTARHRDWPGLVKWFDRVSEHVPADAVVVSDQSGFAAPLRFIYTQRAFEVHFPDKGSRRADIPAVLETFLEEGSKVLYLSSHPVPAHPRVAFTPVFEAPLSTHIVRTAQRMPTGTKSRGGDFILYRATTKRGEEP